MTGLDECPQSHLGINADCCSDTVITNVRLNVHTVYYRAVINYLGDKKFVRLQIQILNM